MLSKISGFLIMATVSGCFLLFFYNNQTHRTIKAQSRGHKNRHFKHMYLNFVFCEISFERPLKNSSSIVTLIVKDTKFLDFQFFIPPTYNTAKYVFFCIFVAIAIAVFCVQQVK